MRYRTLLVPTMFCTLSTGALAQQVPVPVFTDPPVDIAHPAAMTVLHIPSHGVLINGLIYQPSGPGPHPTLIICHGLPGNEKNLDLAQAVRRAGWNAVSFNYRGSWGSPGVFRFTQTLGDAQAVLAFLREPITANGLASIRSGSPSPATAWEGGWSRTLRLRTMDSSEPS
jgi:predicted alpha/beta-fold hydrolase